MATTRSKAKAPAQKTLTQKTSAPKAAPAKTRQAKPASTVLPAVTVSVEQRAYEIWIEQGCPEGRALEHWLQAEQEVSVPSRRGTKSRAVARSV